MSVPFVHFTGLAQRARVAALLLATALGSAVHAQQPLTTVRVGTIAGLGTPGVFAAIDQGYFAARGLDIKLQALGSGPAVTGALIGGSLDVGYGDVFAWAAAVSNGQKLKLLTSANTAHLPSPVPGSLLTVLVRKDGGITKPADLVGKSIGATPAPLLRVTLKRWLEAHQVDWNKVKFVSIASIPALNAALGSGNVDAVLNNDPYTQEAIKDFGAVALAAPLQDLTTKATIAALYATDEYLKASPDVARRFVAAYREGAAYFLRADQAERGRIVEKYSQIKLSRIAEKIPDIVQSFHYHGVQAGPLDVPATQEWVATAHRLGEIPANTDIRAHLFDTATAP